MENDAELVEKLHALLDAERDFRDALEEVDEDLGDEIPDSLESLDAALAKLLRLERWTNVLRELRRPDGRPTANAATVSEYFDRR